MHDRLERIATPDGDHLTLARMGIQRGGTPHLLVVHGLEATIQAKYAHGLLEQAHRLGWSGDLMLFRTCDGEPNSAPRLYHSGETGDLAHVIRSLHDSGRTSPLFVCGVSLGGNVLLKWLGEAGVEAQSFVSRAAAVSVPFDLARGSRFLERGLSRFYTRHFLKTLAPKAIAKAKQFPGIIEEQAVRSARTFWEFDDAATAPLHGFRDAADYYEKSSSLRFLDRIAVETLLFCALDDPFIPPDVFNEVRAVAERLATIHLDFTTSGGHVGWVEGPPWNTTYFMESRVIEFLHTGS
jgi:predicted alpha/beta-fold hydrolase